MKTPAKKTAAPAKRKRTPEPDFNQIAQHSVMMTTREVGPVEVPTESEISRVMRELGRRGGKIGGKRRMVTLTSERRSEIAFQAAKKRWEKKG